MSVNSTDKVTDGGVALKRLLMLGAGVGTLFLIPAEWKHKVFSIVNEGLDAGNVLRVDQKPALPTYSWDSVEAFIVQQEAQQRSGQTHVQTPHAGHVATAKNKAHK